MRRVNNDRDDGTIPIPAMQCPTAAWSVKLELVKSLHYKVFIVTCNSRYS